jgi:hypothetical protein
MRRVWGLLIASACGAAPPAPIGNTQPSTRTTRHASGPFAPRPLAGPFRSIADWCAQIPPPKDGEDPTTCLPTYAPLVTRGPTRIDRAELVPFAERAIAGPTCALAIQREGQYWIDTETELACLPWPGHHSIYITIAVEELAWRDVIRSAPSGEAIGPELVLAVASHRHTATINVDVSFSNEIVCGVGTSEHVACTPPIPMTSETVIGNILFHPAIASDGTLSFDVDDPEASLSSYDDYRRSYPLVFP